MVGHLNVPALDNSGTASSMSQPITEGLLRNRLGFEGTGVHRRTRHEGCDTPGWRRQLRGSAARRCRHACRAGIDTHCDGGYTRGRKNRTPVGIAYRQSVPHRTALEIRPRTFEKTIPSPAGLKEKMNGPESENMRRRLTAASIICLDNADGLLPLHRLDTTSIAVVNIGAPPTIPSRSSAHAMPRSMSTLRPVKVASPPPHSARYFLTTWL